MLNNSTYKTDRKVENSTEHLCYLISQGFHISDAEEFKTLINRPKFACRHCSRHANNDINLCMPEKLDIEY
jgi:hypothetical protein